MEVRLLGPLEVVGDHGPIALTSPLQIAILTQLALNVGHSVHAEVLLDAAWEQDPPASGLDALRYQISKLRDTLDPDRTKRDPKSGLLQTTSSGYVLALDQNAVDASRFRALADLATETAGQNPSSAIVLADEALALWRGEALADVLHSSFAAFDVARLEALRSKLTVERLGWLVDAGDAAAAAVDLQAMARAEPDSEIITATLMKALYASGQHTEAIATATRHRKALAEAGLTVSPTIAELEEQILLHSPELAPQPAAVEVATNLPQAPNRFIGRQVELTTIADQLADSRLVTLTGFGGIGKSRLAIETAASIKARYPDGVWLIELARALTGETFVAQLAATLGVDDTEPAKPLDPIVAALADKQTMLILDNCEHLLDSVRETVERLVWQCPRLAVLATSRVPLGLDDETAVPVGPLSLGDGSDAVELFTERARTAGRRLSSGDPVALDICERLGGIPLALELAAARTRVITPQELLSHLLSSGIEVLAKTGASSRRDGLASVLEWSYEACHPDDQTFLSQMALCRGGFDLAAAAAITQRTSPEAIQTLDRLIGHAFITPTGDERSRYSITEAVREFAAGKLQPSLKKTAAARHATHYLDLVEDTYDSLFGSDQGATMALLDPEIDNIRAVFDSDSELRPRLAAQAWRYLFLRDRSQEAANWLRSVDIDKIEDVDARLRGLYGAGIVLWYVGDVVSSRRFLDACLIDAMEAGETRTALAARTAVALGKASIGLLDESRTELESIVADAAMVDPWRHCFALAKLMYVCRDQGDLEELTALVDRGPRSCADPDPFLHAEWLLAQADAELTLGTPSTAAETLQQALKVATDHQFRSHEAWALMGLGQTDVALARWDSARSRLGTAYAIFNEMGTVDGELEARATLALAHAQRGDIPAAQRLLGGAADQSDDSFIEKKLLLAQVAALVELLDGQTEEAEQRLSTAMQMQRRSELSTRAFVADLVAAANATLATRASEPIVKRTPS